MRKRVFACWSMLLATVLATVLPPGVTLAGAEAVPPDPVAEHLFPPDLVMAHGREIGLDERQRTAIKEAVQASQSKFIDAQWALQEEAQKMVELLQARPVDEAAVLAQADRVMNLEREVKRTHLSLLIRIKNVLREPQQARLKEIRKAGGR